MKIHNLRSLWLTFSLFIAPQLFASVVPSGTEKQLKARYDNGYQEARFNQITAQFERLFAPIFASKGARFFVDTDWGDGAVNGRAWRVRTR